MVACVVTAYFSNNTVRTRRIGLARAVVLKDHCSAMIPPEANLFEVRSVGKTILVPDRIVFAIPKSLHNEIESKPAKGDIYKRDQGMCAYCGKKIKVGESTIDHVFPKSRGGKNTWLNLVLSCQKCNTKKADRTPAEAGMNLLVKPYVPKMYEFEYR
jgi:hypothetical protein